MNTFSITDAFSFGWEKIKSNSRIVFSATLIIAAIELLMRFSMPEHPTPGSVAVTAVGTIIAYVLGVGFTIITLKISRGHAAELREIVPPMKLFIQYLLASLAVWLMALAAIVAGILAGGVITFAFRAGGLHGAAVLFPLIIGTVAGTAGALWVLLRYFFVRFAAIDGERPIRSILSGSAELSANIKGQLLLFIIAIAAINILGALTVIGLLLSIPLTLFAIAHAYLHMSGKLAIAPSTAPAGVVEDSPSK
jgi:hypothetical protein